MKALRLLVAVLLGLLFGLLYYTQRHRGLYGPDGPLFVEMWSHGIWVFTHFLYFPLARLCAVFFEGSITQTPADAMRLVSVFGAGLLVFATFLNTSRTGAFVAALYVTACAALAPGQRFFAGAVEIHALAGGVAALALLLVSIPCTRRRSALLLAGLAYFLCSLTHLTSTLLGPAFWLLHVARERATGRPLRVSSVLLSAVLLLFCGLLAVDLVVLLEETVRAHDLYFASTTGIEWKEFSISDYSAIQKYLEAMVLWEGKAPGPSALALVYGEFLAPLGLLLCLACLGAGVTWREGRDRLRACGLWLWIGALLAVALKVGAREYGAYLIPALPALALLALPGVLRFCARATPLRATCLVFAATSFHLGIALFAEGRTGALSPADLAVPATLRTMAALVPEGVRVTLACVLSALALLCCAVLGWVLGGSRTKVSKAGLLGSLGALALVLVMSLWGVESFRQRWPDLQREALRSHAQALKGGDPGQESSFWLTASPVIGTQVSVEWHWALSSYLGAHGVHWLDLALLDTASSAAHLQEMRNRMRGLMEAARVRGCQVWLADDAIGLLWQQQRVLALAFVRDVLARREAQRLPSTGHFPLRADIEAFDAAR